MINLPKILGIRQSLTEGFTISDIQGKYHSQRYRENIILRDTGKISFSGIQGKYHSQRYRENIILRDTGKITFSEIQGK